MSTEEDSMPMLALKNSRTGRIAATALEKKGLTEFGARFFARFIQSSGLSRYMNWSDAENAMKALKEAAAKACPAQESVPREVPQGDHQANGEIESAVRELKRQMSCANAAGAKFGIQARGDGSDLVVDTHLCRRCD